MNKKTPKRGRPRSAGPARIPKQIKFQPYIYNLLIEMWQKERRRALRNVSRQEIMEKAVVVYACAYHPKLVKNTAVCIGPLDRIPTLSNLLPLEKAVAV